jgi:hypothetical protein
MTIKSVHNPSTTETKEEFIALERLQTKHAIYEPSMRPDFDPRHLRLLPAFKELSVRSLSTVFNYSQTGGWVVPSLVW